MKKANHKLLLPAVNFGYLEYQGNGNIVVAAFNFTYSEFSLDYLFNKLPCRYAS